MSCPIKINSNTIELRVHPSCYCTLGLLCVIFPSKALLNPSFQAFIIWHHISGHMTCTFCCCFQVSVEWQRLLLDYFYAAPRFRQRVRKAIFETGKPTISRFHILDLSHIWPPKCLLIFPFSFLSFLFQFLCFTFFSPIYRALSFYLSLILS